MSDPLVELETLSARAPAALEALKLGRGLEAAQEAAKSVPQDLLRLNALLDAAIALDAGQKPALRTTIEEAFEQVENVGALLNRAQDPEQLKAVSHDYPTLKAGLGRLERRLREYWNEVFYRDFEPLRTVGAILEQLPQAAALGRDMSTAAQRAQGVAQASDATAFASRIADALAERTAVNKERKALLGEPELDAFLDAAASGAATLEHVTPSVLTKLRELGALGAFKIQA